MTAIQAASAGVRDMADGSLRITLEFEPRHAKDAYALFGARGTPVAVAALKAGFEQKAGTLIEPTPANGASNPAERGKVGPLAWEAIQLCNNVEFQNWFGVIGPLEAADYMRVRCEVASRNEFDTDAAKGKSFILRVRIPFFKHMRELGETA